MVCAVCSVWFACEIVSNGGIDVKDFGFLGFPGGVRGCLAPLQPDDVPLKCTRCRNLLHRPSERFLRAILHYPRDCLGYNGYVLGAAVDRPMHHCDAPAGK